MASARDRVFDTPELLEMILLQIEPLEDLLLAQRISPHIHSAITSSPRIQQALFFRPEPNKITQDLTAWRLNPILRKCFCPWFVHQEEIFEYPAYSALLKLDGFKKSKKALLRAEASWRKMLILQPPPQKLTIISHFEQRRVFFKQQATVPFDKSPSSGVTMDFLYDFTEAFLRTDTTSRFGLSVENTEAGPQMTMHLVEWEDGGPAQRDDIAVISKGAKSTSKDRKVDWEYIDGDYASDAEWDTDLTEQQGAMSTAEWRRWRKERGIIR